MFRWFLGALLAILLLTFGVRAEDKYFDADGVKVRYVEQGKGEPVLLIHGFGGNVELQWVIPGVFSALAKDHHVIAYDVRGHGKSGKPHDVKAYGLQMVEDPVRLLDHLKIRKAHVVGYSMGAIIAAKLLVTHPDRLLTVTLGGGGPMIRDERLLQFTDRLAESLEQGKGIGPLLEALTPPGKAPPSPEQIKTVSKFFTAFNDTKALAAVARSFKALPDSEAQLKANRVPTLALIGSDDPLKKLVDPLPGRLTNLQVIVLAGANHMTAFTSPRFVEALQRFLAAYHTSGKSSAAPSK
jgi:pimeloyl-ACP methyl ester carboxylesterase